MHRTQTNSNSGLWILQWNCNGIVAHQNELKKHIAENRNKYDIICLQETHLKPDKKFSVAGYNVVRRDRVDGSKGGVITLVKEYLNYTQLSNPVNIECIRIQIKLVSSYLTVANIYLPPDKAIDKGELSKIFGHQTIVTGDINAKSKLWGSPVSNERGLIFEELIATHNAAVINTGQPTYQHHSGSRSHLDVSMVSSTLAARSNWTVLNNTMGSDHCPTVITINEKDAYIEKAGPSRFKLSKADWGKFKGICNETLTRETTYDKDIDVNSRRITEVITSAAQRCIPKPKPGRAKLQHNPVPYWNEQCKTAIYARNRARNKLNNKITPENVENYKKLKGLAQKTVKEAASDYWQEFCGTLNRTTNLSVVWNMTKKMNGIVSQRKPGNFEHNGKLIETDLEKANSFAESFAKISSNSNYSHAFMQYKQQAEKEYDEILTKTEKINQTDSTLDDPFNLSELRRAIRETKKHSAPGDDGISYEMLQHLSKRSTKILLELYDRVWTEGKMPQDWRHSIVKPVLKSGKDPQAISSYRPISLTSTVGKIMEKLVTNRLTYYVEKNKLLANVQSGFRKGRSTTDHIIRLQDTINKYNCSRGYTAAVFIDFQSAYDMLWHKGLLRKLSGMGINGKAFAYIEQFVTNRTMQVRVGSELSVTHNLENGTPQGSIISPLLFLIMINDLPNDITETETTLFADDSCLFKSGRNLDFILHKMQNSLNKLVEWCDLNGFKISKEKTVAVLFTHRRDHIDGILRINGSPVKVERKAKFLGIVFDSRLTWNDHVNYVVEKCKKRLNLLRAISGNSWGANKKTLLMIYRSLIRSVLDYGAIALDSMSKQNKQKFDSIQAQALRIASGAVRGTSNAAMQVDMGEPPLQLRRLQQQLQYTVKVKSTEEHPARKIFEPHWTTLCGKYTENSEPIYSKVRDFIREHQTIDWDSPRLPPSPPWRRKECSVDISVSKAGNKKHSPETVNSMARERIDACKEDIHIYTDASKNLEGKTAAAFCIPELEIEYSARLTDGITIFTAELMAIKLSLLWIVENSNNIKSHKNISLFSDSLSALKAIKTGKTDCRPNMLNEIYELINIIDQKVTLVWIPSHQGIKGNEKADQGAQQATKKQFVDLDVNLELKEINHVIMQCITEKWQNAWTSSIHGKFYRKIEPTVSSKIKYSHSSRAKEVTVSRLRFGKCRLNDYLCSIKAADSEKCSECGVATETVEHFVLDCPNSELCKIIRATCKSLGIEPKIEITLSHERIVDTIHRSIKRKL